ncbi:lysine N(6)-hydroxylase/L-ornithine N(5)-oxygenase family protein [Tumebacillus flagellatus]|uniref:L-lysine N6-monooxygenase MbtG n=1 Tax=Tumebacillus flagellatus TaxID=1157490 RepID=A0A074LKC6_9BACL|nr:SidA/IucD/PvdA family monooxygenase [Tumebacillus flagellatus]KEO82586.1 hypothetical protein EL26_14465 [Tumebacillus flagellatus]
MAFEGKVYDLIGVGFGPSNLSLAVAVADEMENAGADWNLEMLFLEQKPGFVWHEGMLIKNTNMQISFMKDLITLRNPKSRFTFLNYIKEQNRLDEFINLKEFYPTRIEFNDYMAWVAQHFENCVRYGQTVTSIHPVTGQDGEVEYLEVSVTDADGQASVFRTRHLVVASGGTPTFPATVDVPQADNVFHSHNFLYRLNQQFSNSEEPYRFLIVGGGQSSAEIFTHLVGSYPNADVTVAMRAFNYKPADGSELVNQIFFPEMTDFFYELSPENREKMLRAHYNTNYAVVDSSLIRSIYKMLYDQRVVGVDRFRILSFLELKELSTQAGEVFAMFENVMTRETVQLQSDAVIMATGYDRPKRHPLLKSLEPFLVTVEDGGYEIEREYRLVTKAGFKPSIFVQGVNEGTHGLSDTLLSVLPYRASEILRSLHQQMRTVINSDEVTIGW